MTSAAGAEAMSHRIRSALAVVAVAIAGNCFAEDVAQVVSAIRESTQDTTRLTSCLLLAQAARGSNADAATKKKASELVTQRLKNLDTSMLRARGDVARKGLYGYEQNEDLAFRLYSKATRSVEAGWNGALMLYQRSPNGISANDARLILELLQKSGAATANSRGVVGSYAHYVAGRLNEAGTSGKRDVKGAFIHYRTSARNAYVPGAYHYMRLLVQSIPSLPATEKGVVMQEIRMMVNRWKWQSAEIMFLAGDIYAARWLPDEDGFMAQYHWRMARKMGPVREIADFDGAVKSRVRKLSPELERRLEEAVEAGFKNTMNAKHNLEFVDLCAE